MPGKEINFKERADSKTVSTLLAMLKPLYFLWIKTSFVLGWLNVRLILFIIYYFVVTPLGLIAKICRVNFLDTRIETDKPTYWRVKSANGSGSSDYNRQF